MNELNECKGGERKGRRMNDDDEREGGDLCLLVGESSEVGGGELFLCVVPCS